jgi:hypothetical protein
MYPARRVSEVSQDSNIADSIFEYIFEVFMPLISQNHADLREELPGSRISYLSYRRSEFVVAGTIFLSSQS